MNIEETILLLAIVLIVHLTINLGCYINFKLNQRRYKDYDFEQHIIYRNGVQYIDVRNLSPFLVDLYLQRINEEMKNNEI